MDDKRNGRLVLIDGSNWRRSLAVRVSDEQLPFVADHQPIALVILAKAHVRPGGRVWEPLMYVVEGGHVAAVLALAHTASVSEVVNLAVDEGWQRRGIGTAVMESVVDRCRDRGSNTLELTVHPENHAAAALYRGSGFEPTGEFRDGEPVWSRTL